MEKAAISVYDFDKFQTNRLKFTNYKNTRKFPRVNFQFTQEELNIHQIEMRDQEHADVVRPIDCQ